MKTWKEIIKKSSITAAVLTIGLLSAVSPAKAGWDPIKNTPFDPGTWPGARDSVRDGIRNTANGNEYKLYVHNKCNKPLKVTLEYLPNGSKRWRTKYYSFSPGEKAYLVDTQNRYIALTAKEDYKSSGGYKWDRKQVNMGSTFNTFTYSFTCR